MPYTEVIVYEQCPWNKQHVTSIYRNIPYPVEDSLWHIIPDVAGFAKYRVHENSIFQAIYSDRLHNLAKDVQILEPPKSEEDSGWFLISDEQSYSLSSVFSTLPPSLRIPKSGEQALDHIGLRYAWDPKGFWRGWADFGELTGQDLVYAMERLRFLEALQNELLSAEDQNSYQVWDKYSSQLDLLFQESSSEEENLLLLPEDFPRSQPKRRIASRVNL